MKILIHIGVPKTGSTAIQAHLGLNAGWLRECGIAVPTTGYSEGYGHVLLFEDQTNDHLERLRVELGELERGGTQLVIISWEGLNTFSAVQLDNIKQHLGGRPVEVLAYLREQSEVVQSGYLQAIKQRRQRRSLDDFSTVNRIVTPPHIDYSSLLERYAGVFGRSSIHARIYERKLLQGQNVVVDFLAVIGLQPDARFILAPNEQNISLDVGSAAVLNVVDTHYSDPKERENLVDLLLCHIGVEGSDEKYFLGAAEVEMIRTHYIDSNATVLRDFIENKPDRDTLFSPNKPTWISASGSVELGARKFGFLSGMTDYRTWRGQALEQESLQIVASQVRGWSQPEPQGLWSRGAESRLRFRIRPGGISVHARRLVLRLEGDYFAANESSTVQIAGQAEQRIALDGGDIDLPLSSFDPYGCIDIGLLHDTPTTPLSLGMSDDDRELAYFLRRVSYTLEA
jgi:hypothetical protein